MPSIQKIVITLAFAATTLGQVSQLPDGQLNKVSSVTPVKQITDGQLQAVTSVPSVTPVKQITDGQIQAVTSVPSVTPVKQITDGQIQAVTSAPVAKVTVTPVKQITDGQIQAPKATGASTGVVAVPSNGTIASNKPTATAFTGAANILGWSQEAAVAAVGAAAAFAML